MSVVRFTTGTQFNWRETTYKVRQLLPDSRLNLEDIFTGALLTVGIGELVSALFEGMLAFSSLPDQPKTNPPVLALDDYSEALVAVARFRLEAIQPLLDASADERTRAMVEARATAVGVGAGSLYRWLRQYEASGRDLRALIPDVKRCGGRGKSRVHVVVKEIIDGVIRDKYLVREKATVDDILHEVVLRIQEENKVRGRTEQLRVPSRATVGRRIEAVDVVERFAARHGKRRAKQKFSQYGKAEQPILPLERVEIDTTRLDMIVIDDTDNLPLGRLTLTDGQDCATRYPLGFYLGFEPPSFYTVAECLYHMITFKGDVKAKFGTEHDWLAYGIPFTLAVDNGKEFIGKHLTDACEVLGITVEQMPIRAPHYKGKIERVLESFETMLIHKLPGTTFSNTRERGDYDSVGQACIYLSQIDQIMHIFLLDIYAERFHEGLDGIPARRWEALTEAGFVPRLPSSAEDLRILLGRVEERTIQHYGVEFETLCYNCDDLAPLRAALKGRKTRIKYHPGDLSRIYVYNPFDQVYLEVPALAREYTRGLSLWKHRIIRNQVLTEREKVDIEALGRAKRKIQDIVDVGKRRKRTGLRTKITRWDTNGKASRDVAIPSDKTASASSIVSSSLPAEADPPVQRDLSGLDKQAKGWGMEFSLKSDEGESDHA